jgi:hypothetical protein
MCDGDAQVLLDLTDGGHRKGGAGLPIISRVSR